jgi:hypothetical protein
MTGYDGRNGRRIALAGPRRRAWADQLGAAVNLSLP